MKASEAKIMMKHARDTAPQRRFESIIQFNNEKIEDAAKRGFDGTDLVTEKGNEFIQGDFQEGIVTSYYKQLGYILDLNDNRTFTIRWGN